MDRKQIQWEFLIGIILVIGTVLGVTIPLHLSIQEDLRGIHQEMKDFHGRLCAIEERNHGK